MLFSNTIIYAYVVSCCGFSAVFFTATGVEADSQRFSLSLPLLLLTFSPTPLSLVVITQNK